MLSCSSSYRVQDIAKDDTSLVYELHYAETQRLLEELMRKLYKRNPVQLPGDRLVDERVHSLFEVTDFIEFRECGRAVETKLMEQALAPQFSGDRVFCLMAGLNSMMRHSYGYRSRFYVTDSLNEQKLYKSARNIERLAWRLRAGATEAPLLSDSLDENAPNLSFQRLYGKLIAHQDMMAKIAADANKRTINYVVRSLGSFFFLPL